MGPVVPILRMFDVDKALEFYRDFLGFTVDFSARFTPESPLYMQVSNGPAALHLSEHYGDAAPGAHVRIECSDLAGYHAALIAKRHKFAQPGIETREWGERCVTIADPFGNRVTFYERIAPADC
jgi:uncharacterized glyoxalase superfamily protein PhnB